MLTRLFSAKNQHVVPVFVAIYHILYVTKVGMVRAYNLVRIENETTGAKSMKANLTDEARGMKDRLAGYYDKWYRYNRADDGAAYDAGCVKAVNSGKCPVDRFTLIEANGSQRQ